MHLLRLTKTIGPVSIVHTYHAMSIYYTLTSRSISMTSYVCANSAHVHRCHIYYCVQKNLPCLLEVLLSSADLVSKCVGPLHEAATCGYTEVLEVLLSKGCCAHTALVLAVREGHTNAVRMILDKFDGNPSNDLLRVSIKENFTEITQLLIQANVLVWSADLAYACKYFGDYDTVCMILNTIENVNDDNDAAIRMAVYWGRHHLIRLLINAGASISSFGDPSNDMSTSYGNKYKALEIIYEEYQQQKQKLG